MPKRSDLYLILRRQRMLITLAQATALGYSESAVGRTVASGEWTRVFPAVFLVGPPPLDWHQWLLAACLAAGAGGAASHRAAWIIWKLDAVTQAPNEITVPYSGGATLENVIRHRTRRWWRPGEITEVDGIPVTSIERTLAEAGRYLPERIVEVGTECAIRRKLTTDDKLVAYLASGGILVPGAKVLAHVLTLRPPGGPAGSPAEVDLLRAIRAAGLPMPHRQYVATAANGQKYVIDLAWPELLVGLEYNGIEPHAGSSATLVDFDRVKALEDAGWTIKDLGGPVLNKRRVAVIEMIERLLVLRAAWPARDHCPSPGL